MNQLTVSKEKLTNLKRNLTAGAESMALILPESITPDTMIRFALNAAQNNPLLFECTAQSIGLSLMNASAIGLEPNGYDGHLVPYKDSGNRCYTCQFIPDYKGYTKLMHQNPKLQSVSAGAVRAGDDFDFEFGTNAFLRHRPHLTDDRGELIAAWAMYRLKDGSTDFVVMTKNEVLKHKEASPSSGGYKSPWKLWEDAMWAKTAVRILRKFAPLGPGVEKACAYEDAIETGNLPADRTFDADPDAPRITFDVDPTYPDDIGQETPQSKSQDLANKMKQNNSQPTTTAPPEQDLNQPYYRNETELNKALKAATAAENGEAINAILNDAKESMEAGVIDEGIFNWINEQASIALEQLAAT